MRFDWGPTAASLLAADAALVVVVDVLSFTTSVSIATGRGMEIVPYPMGEDGAEQVAMRLGASLAVRRHERTPERPWTLSPMALLTAPVTPCLVVPSPNGSAISASLGARRSPVVPTSPPGRRGAAGRGIGLVVLAGCLRNVSATVDWLRARDFGDLTRPVLLIAAGERWPDGSLRPGLEDQLGAGALAGALERAGCQLSAEARLAARIFAATPDYLEALRDCASGRELAEMGFPEEAGYAAALDADSHASVMEKDRFVKA